MLKVFAGFVIMVGIFFGWLPLIFTSAFFALEVLVACLQAYVFAILACLYLQRRAPPASLSVSQFHVSTHPT